MGGILPLKIALGWALALLIEVAFPIILILGLVGGFLFLLRRPYHKDHDIP